MRKISIILFVIILFLFGCGKAKKNITFTNSIPAKNPVADIKEAGVPIAPYTQESSSSMEQQPEQQTKQQTKQQPEQQPEKLESPKIVVKKADRILELWDGDDLFDTYPIGLGFSPEGDKAVEGDGRTPEGTYYVCVRNANSKFYKSLGVSYPNKEGAKVALETGTIDIPTYNSIVRSIDNKAQPPWNTAMGGQIMIHGHGSDSDWTAGCVAVDDEVMDILWKYCPIKTPIIIEP